MGGDQAGIEIYALAKELMHIDTLHQAHLWTEHYLQRCEFWADFLEQRSYSEGRWSFTHERLRAARHSLNALVGKNVLFTYLEPDLAYLGPLPRTNNRIEGGVNAQLRAVLRNHRGLSLMRRVKAVYWWCYLHTECPKTPAEMLRSMPADEDIDLLYDLYAEHPKTSGEPAWGETPVWQEFHNQTPYPFRLD